MEIQAIETNYNGWKFRSRLEARWAVFFDEVGIEYHYEPEGFDLGGIKYLPDFWLPQLGLWAEVKPKPLIAPEMLKATLLAQGSGFSVLLLIGVPDLKSYTMIKPEGPDVRVYLTLLRGYFFDDPRQDNHSRVISYFSKDSKPTDDEIDHAWSKLKPAIVAARQARFGVFE